MKVASMPPNPPSSKGPAPNLGLNKASYSAHLNRNYGKRPCHRHWDPSLEALQTALSSSCTEANGQDPFICGITLQVKPGRPHHLLSWGNEEGGGSAGSKAKAGELQWPTGHYLPVNWVFCYWELLEGKLVFSHIHLKHPVEQHPENWVSAPGRPQTFGG